MELERVQKIIAASGLCSRRAAEELIGRGKVTVNGKSIHLGDKADALHDLIKIEGRTLSRPQKVYFLLNKPVKTVTTLYDPQGRTTVVSLIVIKERVIPVGRLDYMTEGLLILTNDGEFANLMMHPRYEVEKEYHVRLDKPLTEEHIKEIAKGGIDCREFKSAPAVVRPIGLAGHLLSIIVHEGKNRLVRRIFDKLGYKVYMLARVRIGPLHLGTLPSGGHRMLSTTEVRALRDLAMGAARGVPRRESRRR